MRRTRSTPECMRTIMIGAGGITRAVLGRLGERWEVMVVDTDEDRLERAAAVRTIIPIVGDGSSRVVLERAGMAEADAVVVAVEDDETGIEACRLAREAGVDRVIAVALSPERLADYRRTGATVVSADRLAARHVEINLERRRVASAAFANGRAEAVEFRISPDSPLRARPLRELGLHSWLVAAVLRGDELIVPNGLTELQTDDLVTVVGAADDLGAMVATFTSGSARFPLEYGRAVALVAASMADLGTTLPEAVAFTRATAAETLIVIHDAAAGSIASRVEEAAAADDTLELRPLALPNLGAGALADLRARESIGTFVLPHPRGRLAAVSALRMTAGLATPVLFAAGTPRYRSVITPGRDTPGAWRATWVAIDVAAELSQELVAVGVIPPRFIAGEEQAEEVRSAVSRVREEASVHGVSVRAHTKRGNPVRAFTDFGAEHLIVLAAGQRPTLFTPGITGHVLAGSRSSVLVVPERART
jgi:trk/ktr system potassium uptake protein